MKRALRFVLFFLLAAGAGGAAAWLYFAPDREETSVRPGPPSLLAEASGRGRIEPEGGVLSLGIPGPDRIAEVLVHEGDTVSAGQVLVVFDSHSDRQLEKELADAHLAEARPTGGPERGGAAQVELEKLARQQVETVEPLEIEAQKRKVKMLGEQRAMPGPTGSVSAPREATSFPGRSANSRNCWYARARRTWRRPTSCTRSCPGGTTSTCARPRPASRPPARTSIAPAARSPSPLSRSSRPWPSAGWRRRNCAPIAGRVLRLLLHPGELTTGQPILQMANTEHMIVVAEIYETDVPRVRKGQRATVESKVVPAPALTGTVIAKGGSISKGANSTSTRGRRWTTASSRSRSASTRGSASPTSSAIR